MKCTKKRDFFKLLGWLISLFICTEISIPSILVPKAYELACIS